MYATCMVSAYITRIVVLYLNGRRNRHKRCRFHHFRFQTDRLAHATNEILAPYHENIAYKGNQLIDWAYLCCTTFPICRKMQQSLVARWKTKLVLHSLHFLVLFTSQYDWNNVKETLNPSTNKKHLLDAPRIRPRNIFTISPKKDCFKVDRACSMSMFYGHYTIQVYRQYYLILEIVWLSSTENGTIGMVMGRHLGQTGLVRSKLWFPRSFFSIYVF